MIKRILGFATATLALALTFAQSAHAQLTTASSTEIVTSMVSDISDVLADTLPVVFGVVGILIGLFFAIRIIRKWIGRAK